jgi:hypothetical protein
VQIEQKLLTKLGKFPLYPKSYNGNTNIFRSLLMYLISPLEDDNDPMRLEDLNLPSPAKEFETPSLAEAYFWLRMGYGVTPTTDEDDAEFRQALKLHAHLIIPKAP